MGKETCLEEEGTSVESEWQTDWQDGSVGKKLLPTGAEQPELNP